MLLKNNAIITLILTYFLLFQFSFEKISNKRKILNFINSEFDAFELDVFFNMIKKIEISQEDSQKLIDNLKKILERYVYLDILKNPPQPQLSEKYHNKVDLIDEISIINTNKRPLYDFYRDLKIVISKAQDLHFDLQCKRKIDNDLTLDDYIFIPPVKYSINVGKPFVYVDPNFEDFFEKELIETIKNNFVVPISKINGISPLDYIQKFNKEFNQLKSPQAQFVFNQNAITSINPNSFPFNKKDLENIEIELNNGVKIKFNYKVLIKKKDSKIILSKLNSNNVLLNNINIYDFSKNYLTKIGELKYIDNVKWDKSIENGQFKCTVDEENKVNVIVQSSFDLDRELTKKTISECFTLFDNNKYPIIIIENFNGGGFVEISQYLAAHININSPIFGYTSYRYNDDVKKNVASYFKSREIKTCKTKNDIDFFKEFVIDEYGEIPGKIQHKRTIISNHIEINRTEIYDIRSKMKNIRKPTDIIIFTDGYSYSATSDFIKSTQLLGGAIIVGFNGNPEIRSFDASQSESSVINTDEMNDELSNEFKKLNFSLSYTVKEYFSDIDYPTVQNIPLEFKIHLIDERIDYYRYYDDEHYYDFVHEGKKIYEKYKFQCNNANKLLIYNANNCTFDKKLLHGGFECGDDGKWNITKCVPSYCDNGYIFDKIKKECIKDICIEKKSIILLWLGIIFIIIGVIFLVIFFICYCDGGFKKEALTTLFIIFIICLIVGIIFLIIR